MSAEGNEEIRGQEGSEEGIGNTVLNRETVSEFIARKEREEAGSGVGLQGAEVTTESGGSQELEDEQQDSEVQGESESAEEEPIVEVEKPRVSKQFAAIRAAQRKVDKEKAELRAEQDRLKALAAEVEKWEKEKAALAEDAPGFFRSLGIDTDVLGKTDPTDEQASRIAKLEKRLEDERKAREQFEANAEAERQRVKLESNKRAVYSEISTVIDGNPEYELLRAQGKGTAEEAVFEVIRGNYEKTGRTLTYKEAAGYLESHLEKEAESMLKAYNLKKKKPFELKPEGQEQVHKDRKAISGREVVTTDLGEVGKRKRAISELNNREALAALIRRENSA